jgi:putative heme-binding domain-containing protein
MDYDSLHSDRFVNRPKPVLSRQAIHETAATVALMQELDWAATETPENIFASEVGALSLSQRIHQSGARISRQCGAGRKPRRGRVACTFSKDLCSEGIPGMGDIRKMLSKHGKRVFNRMRAPHSNLIGSTLVVLLVLSSVVSRVSASAIDHAQGGRLYQVHCASCHGVWGEGDRGPSLIGPRLVRAPTDEAFLKIIANGISGTEMPRFALADGESADIVAWVRQLGRLSFEPVPGSPARGARLYATKGGCVACHFLRGEGGALGPDLTEIGLRRGAAYLRTALLEPHAHVPKIISAYPYNSRRMGNFLFVRVVSQGGETVTGVRLNEDTFSIQLRDVSGRFYSFYKSELSELHKEWGWSPMPAYGTVFSGDEMTDVVAFLASMKGEQ